MYYFIYLLWELCIIIVFGHEYFLYYYILIVFIFIFLFFERLLVLNINSTRRLLGIFFSLGERNGYTIRLLPLSLLFVISKQLDRLEDS